MSSKTDKILVEIAAYCDPELLNTVKSAMIQADNPNRIFFAICYQDDNVDIYNELLQMANCKLTYLTESQARGSVFARYLCQKMIEDEKYIFQIDSHMRFVKHWDTKLIEELESLNDKKGILSVYPPFCNEQMMALPLDDPTYDKPAQGGMMYTDGFRDPETYFVQCNSLPLEKNDPRAYKKNAFLAAGNMFTYAEAHKVVIHDPDMYFYGDEMPMSIRLFTHGWNVYNPGVCYVYHQYERKNQKFPAVTNAMLDENKKLMKLLSINTDEKLEKYGLGTERSLKEYEDQFGIDFNEKLVYMNAELGEYDNEKYKGKVSYIQQKRAERSKLRNIKEKIEVIIIDLFDEYKDCVKWTLSKSQSPEYIEFIIATKNGKEPSPSYIKKNNIKKIIVLSEDDNYVTALSKATKHLGDSYVAQIDASMRLLKGWDKYLIENAKLCGPFSALTSWVWLANKETDLNDFYNYNNVVKDLDKFYNNLPYLKYNDSINISKRTRPYLTPYISDGFIFTKSDVFKNIPVDPTLTYEEHQYLYAVRMWTNGIDIYYPQSSYIVRTKEEQRFHGGAPHQEKISALLGLNNYQSKKMESNYEYDLGDKRPIWAWYDFIKVEYNAEAMKIIEEKK